MLRAIRSVLGAAAILAGGVLLAQPKDAGTATDLLNTMRIPKKVVGDGFQMVSTDYLETRAVRLTWSWIF